MPSLLKTLVSKLHIEPSLLKSIMSGVINGTAPNPVRLAEMCEQLGNVMGRPSWLPVPDFALKAVLGEGASVVRVPSYLLAQNPVFAKH